MHATIDMTGLPDALAITLKNQMEAMVEHARAALPFSFQERVERALYELPESEGHDVRVELLAPLLEAELRTHIEKLELIELIIDAARNSVDWGDETFGNEEFEHQLRRLIGTLFV